MLKVHVFYTWFTGVCEIVLENLSNIYRNRVQGTVFKEDMIYITDLSTGFKNECFSLQVL